MAGRIITLKKEICMSQLDIPHISHLHSITMEEIEDKDTDMIYCVTLLKIRLRSRGLKLHLANEDS